MTTSFLGVHDCTNRSMPHSIENLTLFTAQNSVLSCEGHVTSSGPGSEGSVGEGIGVSVVVCVREVVDVIVLVDVGVGVCVGVGGGVDVGRLAQWMLV